jgi:hypothetical protein
MDQFLCHYNGNHKNSNHFFLTTLIYHYQESDEVTTLNHQTTTLRSISASLHRLGRITLFDVQMTKKKTESQFS